jgi:thioredoxin-like negative regulator of GroEL
MVRSEKVSIVKINTEKYPALASKYQINALPTLVLFKGGKPVDRVEGLPTAEQLRQRVQYFLG